MKIVLINGKVLVDGIEYIGYHKKIVLINGKEYIDHGSCLCPRGSVGLGTTMPTLKLNVPKVKLQKP